MNEVEKKLMAARALTATTGVMHDIQVQLLKNWAALAFGAWYGWECNVSIDTKTVLYKLTPEGKFKVTDKELAPYVASLDKSIHWLLGDDWALNIDLKGKSYYRGERKKKKTNDERKSRVQDSARRKPA